MLISLPRHQADAILGAMRAIALEHGPAGVTETDRATIAGAATIVLGLPEPDVATIEPVTPDALARELLTPEDAKQAVRMLAVMSLADGVADPAKTALVREYAAALDVHEEYLQILTQVCAGEIAEATACLVRKNAESFPHLDKTGIDEDHTAPFLPYRNGNDDPELAARYELLGALPDGTFGHAFYHHFKDNGFAFPGDPNGMAEGFTTPHDSAHVLSGYSTSQPGEICVSTFIGAMHPDHPMAAEVLPVIYSWHVGVHLNDIAGKITGAYEPKRFWTAWDRGAATTVDIVAADWDFWGATEQPLADLRHDYAVPPVDPALLA